MEREFKAIFGCSFTLFVCLILHPEFIPLIDGHTFIDAQHLYGGIHIAEPQVADSSRNVENELADTDRRREDFGGQQDLTSKQAVKEMRLELTLDRKSTTSELQSLRHL